MKTQEVNRTVKDMWVNEEYVNHEREPQEISQFVWRDKYALPHEKSFEDTMHRVSKALADTEETDNNAWEEIFYHAMVMGATPGGRITANAGAIKERGQASLINCTVSETIEDSIDGIMRAAHNAAITLSAGCGIGYDCSTIRYNGAEVSGVGARTLGPLTFMEIYDATCKTISSAGGRRGAQMLVCDIRHPDIENFINAKRRKNYLTQFNMSVLITDKFLKAVEYDEDWNLVFPEMKRGRILCPDGLIDVDFPIPGPTKDYWINEDNRTVSCRIIKTTKARKLWKQIMESTYNHSDPGFVCIDRINENNPLWFCEDIRATNPCVTDNTWIMTKKGAQQVKDLIGKKFTSVVDGKFHKVKNGFFCTGKKNTLVVKTKEGHKLNLTLNHKIRVATNVTRYKRELKWIKAKNLKSGDNIVLHNHRDIIGWKGYGTRNEGYLLGLLVGDGYITKERVTLTVWTHQKIVGDEYTVDTGIKDKVTEIVARMGNARGDFKGWREHLPRRGIYTLRVKWLTKLASSYGLVQGDKTIKPVIESASSMFYRGFLSGLFDADGSVQGDQKKGISVRLAQSNKPLLQAVQRMLLRLGINSIIYKRKSKGQALLPDGKGGHKWYETKTQYELCIAKDNIIRYANIIGFQDNQKKTRLKNLIDSYTRTPNRENFLSIVESIKSGKKSKVYDVQVPGINAFDANGMYVHNCGEQPLPPFGSCLLGSIDLSAFVQQREFHWEAFKRNTEIFARMLDNVCEISRLPLEQQRKEILDKRRHGMGYLGLGTALALMGRPYGCKPALHFTETATKELALANWRVGLELACEKGCAPILAEDRTTTITEWHMQRIHDKNLDSIPGAEELNRDLWLASKPIQDLIPYLGTDWYNGVIKYGVRYTHATSIAPTGTIASWRDNASAGIEPSFGHTSFRNVIMPGRRTKKQIPMCSAELRRLQYQGVIKEGQDLPEYMLGATDIDPRDHIKIQAVAQKWVDSSISKTINVPPDYSYDNFVDIYKEGYKLELKGCTTYRPKPEHRTGVLVSAEEMEEISYVFVCVDKTVHTIPATAMVLCDGEVATAANLYNAVISGYFGVFINEENVTEGFEDNIDLEINTPIMEATVVSLIETNKQVESDLKVVPPGSDFKRNRTVKSETHKIERKGEGGNVYVTVSMQDDGQGYRPVEMFINGHDATMEPWATSFAMVVTGMMRAGVSPAFMIEQIPKLRGYEPGWFGRSLFGKDEDEPRRIPSVVSEVVGAIKRTYDNLLEEQGYIPGQDEIQRELLANRKPAEQKVKESELIAIGPVCPMCGASVEIVEGCKKCMTCDWTSCD